MRRWCGQGFQKQTRFSCASGDLPVLQAVPFGSLLVAIHENERVGGRRRRHVDFLLAVPRRRLRTRRQGIDVRKEKFSENVVSGVSRHCLRHPGYWRVGSCWTADSGLWRLYEASGVNLQTSDMTISMLPLAGGGVGRQRPTERCAAEAMLVSSLTSFGREANYLAVHRG